MRVIGKLLFVAAFLLSGHCLKAQSRDEMTRFIDNIVMIPSLSGNYGFVVGTDVASKNPFFVLVKENGYFDEKVSVLYNQSGRDKNATLVRKDIRFGRFYIGLYMINGNHTVSKKYYKAETRREKEDNYYTFLNGGATIGNLDLVFHQQSRFKRSFDKNNYLQSPVIYTKERSRQRVYPGMPIVDNYGLLTGIVAADSKMDEDENIFHVIDILAIERLLSDIGKKEGYRCKYFNLVEMHAPNDETICEQSERQQRIEHKRQEEEEEKRIEGLKQQDKMVIDRKVRDSGISSLHQVERRIYRRNINRWIALGPAASAGAQFMDSAIGTYYTLGANIYLSPDNGQLRFTLKPRYSRQTIKVNAGDASGSTKSDFSLSKVRATVYELPVMMELLIKRKEKFNEYWGLGYGVGKVHDPVIEFNTNEGLRKQGLIGAARFIHTLYLYTGIESGRFRFDLGLSYQMQPIYDRDYEIVLSGQSIKPFKDMSKSSLGIGAEVSFRLWNQWRNDYRTMF